MDILSTIQLNPDRWPLAGLTFLRVVTLFFFLPIIGDKVVPVSLRIALGLAFSFFCLPVVSDLMFGLNGRIIIAPLNIFIATLREVFFAFCVGFFAKILFFGASIASNLVGVNMGFQVASMFSPGMNDQESAFSNFKYWIIIVVLLSLNVHHLLVQGIVGSFYTVPIGSFANASSLSSASFQFVTETFELALRLAAPLIAVQILINVAMGLLNRAMPSMNVFVISFPLSFLLSMMLLFIVTGSLVSFISGYGSNAFVAWFQTSFRLFFPK